MEFAQNQYSQLEAVFSSSSPAVFGRPGAKIQTVPAAPAQALPGPAEKNFWIFQDIFSNFCHKSAQFPRSVTGYRSEGIRCTLKNRAPSSHIANGHVGYAVPKGEAPWMEHAMIPAGKRKSGTSRGNRLWQPVGHDPYILTMIRHPGYGPSGNHSAAGCRGVPESRRG